MIALSRFAVPSLTLFLGLLIGYALGAEQEKMSRLQDIRNNVRTLIVDQWLLQRGIENVHEIDSILGDRLTIYALRGRLSDVTIDLESARKRGVTREF